MSNIGWWILIFVAVIAVEIIGSHLGGSSYQGECHGSGPLKYCD